MLPIEQTRAPHQPKELWIHGRALLGQWICHSPNVMKTDIFGGIERDESGKSTRVSIRFDSPRGQRGGVRRQSATAREL